MNASEARMLSYWNSLGLIRKYITDAVNEGKSTCTYPFVDTPVMIMHNLSRLGYDYKYRKDKFGNEYIQIYWN